MTETRKIAAIMAADVVGFSKLAGADEDRTLARLRSLRSDLVDPAIAVHHGRVVKRTGDGALVEFRSVVEESDGDLMGDGVNIAARLEGVATPGAICLSEDAYRQVKARLDIAVNDLGATALKNIADPIRIYSLQVGLPAGVKPTPQTEPAVPDRQSAPLALPDKPSIAILAFQNMSGESEQEFFADGIAEDIITALSKTRWLFVIARN